MLVVTCVNTHTLAKAICSACAQGKTHNSSIRPGLRLTCPDVAVQAGRAHALSTEGAGKAPVCSLEREQLNGYCVVRKQAILSKLTCSSQSSKAFQHTRTTASFGHHSDL